MISELAFPHIRCCLSGIPSDPMKSTVVDESLSSMNQQFCSRESTSTNAFFLLCMYRGIQTSSKHTEGYKHMGGIQTYWGVPTYREHSYMPFYPTKWVLPLVLFKSRSSVEWVRVLKLLQQCLYWTIYWRRYHSRLKSVANSATQLLPINTPS